MSGRRRLMASALRITPALLLAAACAAPSKSPKINLFTDLRVCVQDESVVEAYAKYFSSAVAADPRGGRDCDLTVRAGSALNAGNVTLRSAYDNSVLAEIEGQVDLLPRLAAMSVAPGSEPYRLVTAQRAASGFAR